MLKQFYNRRRNELALLQADVLITSFPKCGRTWLRVMMGHAMQLHYGLESDKVAMLEHFATLFNPGVPNVVLIHDDKPFWKPPDQLNPSKARYAGKKVILVVRDPRDVMVSAYYQKLKRKHKKSGLESGISEFLQQESGSLKSFIAHHNIWADQRDVPRDFLLVRYEDMHEDPHRELRRVFDFMGVPEISDEVIDKSAEFGGFDNMRKMEETNALGSHRLQPGKDGDRSSFKTRKGKVGGYREQLSDGDIEYIEAQLESLSPMYGYSAEKSEPSAPAQS